MRGSYLTKEKFVYSGKVKNKFFHLVTRKKNLDGLVAADNRQSFPERPE